MKLQMEGGARMRMEAYQWKSGQPLTDDYIARFEKTGGLFEYNPWQAGSWSERASWLDGQRPQADRQQVADVLRAFNERAGNAPEALAAVEQLRDPRAVCIVGGQQAGLFTGPLLVVYKAVTLIVAAREAAEKLGRPVIPLFWIAGEDHDFDEVNHIDYLSSSLAVERIKLEHPTGVRTSVSRTVMDAGQWEEAIGQLDASLTGTEFKEDLLAAVREAHEGAGTLTEAFAKLMARLFGAHGLVLLDSDDPALRALEGPMFRRLLEQGKEVNDALLAGVDRLKTAGYTPQVELQTASANLFAFGDGGERILIYRTEDGYADRKGERRFTRDELLAWADREPQRLSNNVMTRPLMQDYLFPVLAAVLGPSEIAYWGQTGEAFRFLGMRMPILLPRIGFTLVEGTIQKNMPKYGLTIEDVMERMEEKREAWLQEQDAYGLESRFAEVKASFQHAYQPLVDTLGEINPGLKKLGDTNLAKILEQIDFLHGKAEDGLRSQHESGLRQLQRIEASICPGGKAQERVYNVYAYLNRYGRDWMGRLLSLPLEIDGKHRVIYM
ncbi:MULTISPECIES: bacillithiol biosynthesis cysteine-adding enzyme BshC [Paenibacillus]|uniref:bacillithiol biosynthesis cysteine-adding enzyme BshC n=1 Tax=Paenibacillus TaxID=44249 RepID=UPI0022B89F12|nr:bacillithiol biosynthesis cysteine-adding enzyme BshC [Paenibacillus caseinilyticus]MCZ8518763.1 bacillithiol biosynthesis cysteine-adding enzyme BshC [Paenibacillus caseinilyticus]